MNFFRMVIYKLKIMISNKILMLFLIIMPLVTAYIAGYSSKLEQLNIVPIGIVDNDNTLTSKLLIERISKNEEIKLYSLDLNLAQNYLKDSKIESFYILEKGFDQKTKELSTGGIIKVATHRASPNTEFIKEVIGGEVNRLFSTYYTFEAIKGSYDKKGATPESDLFDKVSKTVEGYWNPPLMTYNFTWSDSRNTKPDIENNLKDGENSNYTYHGITLLFIMLFVMFGSTWITEERNNKILLRLHSIKSGFLLNFLSNLSALLSCGLGLQLVIILLIKFVFGLNVLNGLEDLTIYFLYTVFSVALGMLLGGLVKSPLTLQSLAAPMTFILSFVGGCFLNVSELSLRASQLTLFTPQGWALKGLSSDFFMAASIVLLAGTLLFSFSSYWVLKLKSSR